MTKLEITYRRDGTSTMSSQAYACGDTIDHQLRGYVRISTSLPRQKSEREAAGWRRIPGVSWVYSRMIWNHSTGLVSRGNGSVTAKDKGNEQKCPDGVDRQTRNCVSETGRRCPTKMSYNMSPGNSTRNAFLSNEMLLNSEAENITQDSLQQRGERRKLNPCVVVLWDPVVRNGFSSIDFTA